jgi:hypothetical protein
VSSVATFAAHRRDDVVVEIMSATPLDEFGARELPDVLAAEQTDAFPSPRRPMPFR